MAMVCKPLDLDCHSVRALYLKRKQKRPQEGPRMISNSARVPSRQMRKRLIIQPANSEEERRKWIEVWTWKGKDLEVAEREVPMMMSGLGPACPLCH